jgi:hypothetical protein
LRGVGGEVLGVLGAGGGLEVLGVLGVLGLLGVLAVLIAVSDHFVPKVWCGDSIFICV